MSFESHSSSTAYKVDKKKYDEEFERIFGKKEICQEQTPTEQTTVEKEKS